MRFDSFSFGSIRIDGVTCDYDVVIDDGEIRKRKKKKSKQFRDEFGHTPLSIEEDIELPNSAVVRASSVVLVMAAELVVQGFLLKKCCGAATTR
jgi:hypothetical protein